MKQGERPKYQPHARASHRIKRSITTGNVYRRASQPTTYRESKISRADTDSIVTAFKRVDDEATVLGVTGAKEAGGGGKKENV